jgi:preprotein translocase subunit SecB
MVTVTLANQRVQEIHFVNRIDKSGQIQLKSSFNFHVDYTSDNTKCIAKLYQSAQMKEDPEKLFISAEIIGVFTLEGVVDDETKRDAHVQCYDQLFPFLQSTVSQLATASGMPGFLMKKTPMSRDNITFAKKENAPKKDDQPMTLPIV